VLRPEDIDERYIATPRAEAHTVEVDGEAVVLDEESGRLVLLNATGALVWRCLDGASSIAEIVDDLVDVLGARRKIVSKDVVALVRQLGREGLLVGVEEALTDDEAAAELVEPAPADPDEDPACDDDDSTVIDLTEVVGGTPVGDPPPGGRFVAQPPNL
jgi:hypothetical protein